MDVAIVRMTLHRVHSNINYIITNEIFAEFYHIIFRFLVKYEQWEYLVQNGETSALQYVEARCFRS